MASILCGRPPAAGLLTGPLGLRALFSIPMGVDEAVIEEAEGRSGPGRREGTRGIFETSATGLVAGDSSSEPGDGGLAAKSMESSGALGGASFEGVGMDEDVEVAICGA